MKTKLLEIGTVVKVLSQPDFATFVAVEHEKFGKIIKLANIKPE